jgi:hypothetical protein
MSVNRINATLTDAQRDRANAALAALAEALPFLIDLSAKDRADSPKFGDKNRAFVVKALAIAEAHPDMLPGGFNFQEFSTDVQLVESLYPLLHAVETLYGKLTNTSFADGSEAYAAAPFFVLERRSSRI